MNWLRERLPLLVIILLLVLSFVGILLIQNPHDYSRSNTSTYESANTAQNSRFKAHVKDSNVPIEPKANPNPERDEWRTERGLLAQTEATRWAGWMLFVSIIMAFLSAVGVAIVIWTLKETMKAGQKLSEQNDIALNASKAEFQPYLSLSDNIEISSHNTVLEGFTTKATVRREGNKLTPRGFIKITNEGKTPALEGRFSCIGFMRDNDGEFPINLRGQFSYLGAGKYTKAKVLEYILFDREIAGDRFDISGMRFRVEVRISFRDPFSETSRRVFRAIYEGGHRTDGELSGFFSTIKRKSFAEVEPTDTDDIRHWEI